MRKHVIFSCIQFKSCVLLLISTKIDRIPTVAHFPCSRYFRDFICEVTCSKAKQGLPEADTGVIEEIATTIGVDKISNHHQRRNRARKRYTKRLQASLICEAEKKQTAKEELSGGCHKCCWARKWWMWNTSGASKCQQVSKFESNQRRKYLISSDAIQC